MNRKDRRKAEKQSRRMTASSPEMWSSNGSFGQYSRPKQEPPKPPVPGVDVPPECPDFQAQVARNKWHDKNEFMSFVDFINKNAVEKECSLSDMIKPIGAPEPEEAGEPKWSWAYNSKCKYVTLHVDMRDGGFTVLNQDGERINLEQLKWQWAR